MDKLSSEKKDRGQRGGAAFFISLECTGMYVHTYRRVYFGKRTVAVHSKVLYPPVFSIERGGGKIAVLFPSPRFEGEDPRKIAHPGYLDGRRGEKKCLIVELSVVSFGARYCKRGEGERKKGRRDDGEEEEKGEGGIFSSHPPSLPINLAQVLLASPPPPPPPLLLSQAPPPPPSLSCTRMLLYRTSHMRWGRRSSEV